MRHRKKKESGITDTPRTAPGAGAIRLLAGKTHHRGTRRDVPTGRVFLPPRTAVIDEIEDRREAKWASFPVDLRQEASLRHNGADNGDVVGRRTGAGCRDRIFGITQRKVYHGWKESDSSRFLGSVQKTMKNCSTVFPEISVKDAKKT